MPRPVEDRSDVGGAAQFNNIGPVPLSPSRPAFPGPSRFPLSVPLSPSRPAFPVRCDRVRQWSSWSAMVWSC